MAATNTGLAFASYCRIDYHRDEGLHWHHINGGWNRLSDSESIQARPLLVIDPENREDIERIADAFCSIPSSGWSDDMQAALRSLLAPPKPPKPPEPMGLGAVVEDVTGAEWVRVGLSDGFGGVWARVGATDNLLSGEVAVAVLPYGGIHVVRVLADGRVEES